MPDAPATIAVAYARAVEVEVLRALCAFRESNEDFCFVGLATLCNSTGLTRDMARAAVRHLVDLGLAEYSAGLGREDGTLAGSGYAATLAGCGFIARNGT